MKKLVLFSIMWVLVLAFGLLFFASCGKDNGTVVNGGENVRDDEPLTRHLKKIECYGGRNINNMNISSASLITWDGDKIVRIESDPNYIGKNSQTIVDFLYDGDRVVGSNHIFLGVNGDTQNDTLYRVTYHYNGDIIDYVDIKSMYGVNADRHIDYVYDNGKIVRLTVSRASNNKVEDFDWNNGNVFSMNASIEYGNIINPFRFPMGVGYYELIIWEISGCLPLSEYSGIVPFVWCKNMPSQFMSDDIVIDFDWTADEAYPTMVSFNSIWDQGYIMMFKYYYE